MLPKRFIYRGLVATGLSLIFAGAALAASSPVGSGNVTVADPTVPRPPGKPCVVQLFSNDTFDDYATRPFSYAPPTGCQGPWAKVVLTADFSVTAGTQYDRTATIWLGGVNLYFGTTQEPSPTLAPSWHVERDLTDYIALLRQAGQGQAIIGNTVNSTYNGVIHGSAQLLFYPASILAPPAQSQFDDEFWYTCVPDQYAAEVDECGGGNFREAEISIDGQPAGVAPVYPWIYTGGIDPFLWEPTPGVQTLNFMPYRVDLTPFAGVLSNGVPHQVAVSVAGANDYFSATASLLVYLDPHARQISGQIERNTLVGQPATPTIGSTLSTDASGNITGNISTDLSRHFVIEGYADTSHGRVHTQVDATVGFADTQGFVINASTYEQVTSQLTSADSDSQSSIGGLATTAYHEHVRYPLHLDIDQLTAADGSFSVATTTHQGYEKSDKHLLAGFTLYSAKVDNKVDSADTLDFDANENFTGHSGQKSAQTFTFHDSLGGCYRSDVASLNNVVSSYDSGAGCPDGSNRVFWFTHPDGSPDNGNAIPGL